MPGLLGCPAWLGPHPSCHRPSRKHPGATGGKPLRESELAAAMSQVEAYALSLTNVTKSFDRVIALHNLSFRVAEGRFFVLFGPSSVGKTTTLRVIAGLVTPDRGQIEIFGKDWASEP